MKQLHMHFQW